VVELAVQIVSVIWRCFTFENYERPPISTLEILNTKLELERICRVLRAASLPH
jgi:hypothetical protein